jgi:hypothetical protein
VVGVLYLARDMAVLRASLNDAQVVLASATPSLESWANVEAGKYKRIPLPSRFGKSTLPDMAAIDMRTEDTPPGRWIRQACAPRSSSAWNGANNHWCFRTAAAMRQSPSAAPAGIRSHATTAMRGWWNIGSSND